MLWNAENGSVRLDDTEMDYLSFGRGEDALVLLPGLGDGFKTVKGPALPTAWQYRIYAKSYKVYLFSRKNALPEGYSTRDMASDQAKAMETLGIQNACVVGISDPGHRRRM